MILVNLFERPASRLLFCGNSVGALFPVILGAWSQDSNIFETSLHLLIEIILSLKPLNIIPNTQLFHIFFHNKMPYTKCHATVGISANQRHDKLHLKSRTCLVDRQSSPCFYQLPTELGVFFCPSPYLKKNMFLEFWSRSCLASIFWKKNCIKRFEISQPRGCYI